jgi:hypothetical protein
MPAKKAKPTATQSTSSGNIFNIQGGITAKRDVIMGDQENTFYQTQQTLNITSPNEFVEELQKLRAEIERLKSLPDMDPAAARRLVAVEGDIVDAIVEAKKDKPIVERIKSTLDGAKETMEKLDGSIATAMKLGATLGTLGTLALTVWKTFGG